LIKKMTTNRKAPASESTISIRRRSFKVDSEGD
jgi:hypothetical protein